jgi:hypothetical protein
MPALRWASGLQTKRNRRPRRRARGAAMAEFAFASKNAPPLRLLDPLGATVCAIGGHAVLERAAYNGAWRQAA